MLYNTDILINDNWDADSLVSSVLEKDGNKITDQNSSLDLGDSH